MTRGLAPESSPEKFLEPDQIDVGLRMGLAFDDPVLRRPIEREGR